MPESFEPTLSPNKVVLETNYKAIFAAFEDMRKSIESGKFEESLPNALREKYLEWMRSGSY